MADRRYGAERRVSGQWKIKRERAAIPFSVLLAAVFATIVLLTVGGLVAVTQQGMSRLSAVETAASFEALASRVGQDMRMNLDSGLVTLDVLAATPLTGMDPLAAGKMMIDILRLDARKPSTVTAIQLGRPDGSAVIAVRLGQTSPEGADYAIKLVQTTPAGLSQQVIMLDGLGTELLRRAAAPSDFDARSRPWYDAALKADGPITTRPYRYIGQNNVVGVTVARKSMTEAGTVFGIDLTPRSIQGLLRELSGATGADLVLFTPDGRLVARNGSDDAAVGDSPAVADLPSMVTGHDAALADLYRGFQAHGLVRDVELQAGGRAVEVRYVEPVSGSGLLLAISLPLSVIQAPAASLRDQQLLIGLGAILAAILASVLAARGLVRPIQAVTAAMAAISEFDFRHVRSQPSRFEEIDQLWSMVRMLEHTLRTFTCYVPGHLVQDIVRHKSLPMVGGVRKSVTVLFTDVEGFTALSEQQKPEQLMTQMSRYFGSISDVVIETGGIVDKYIGDSVMAFWAASTPENGHAARACTAALAIAARLDALNEVFRREGRPPLRTRFGISTGDCIMGHVGTVDRLSYTVVGHTVNLASRLEQQNKDLGTEILVSAASMRDAGPRFDFRPKGAVVIKGISAAVEVFELRRTGRRDRQSRTVID